MKKRELTFTYALRSFLGYLEGTQKAEHTIKNYRLDLLAFEEFLKSASPGRTWHLQELGPRELEHFHRWLRTQGLKTNTRRRKLMTVRKFLSYLNRRNQLPVDAGRSLPTPAKMERIPWIVPSAELIKAVKALSEETVLERRNRLLLWTLAETGCQVSEIARLRFDDFDASGPSVLVGGKAARRVPISMDLWQATQALKPQNADANEARALFQGFNKFGSLGTPISSRGVELLVRHHAERLGFAGLTPRTFRHSAVLRWHKEGRTQKEIQALLGLKSDYAFRAYQPLFSAAVKSTTETTSSS